MAFIKKVSGNVSIVRDSVSCICENDEHQLIFRYFINSAEDNETLYCTFHLKPESNFFKRMLIAIKYIFGYRSKYGEFDEVLLDSDKVEELKNILSSFQNNNNIK